MTSIEPGDFWVGNIPFTKGADSKKRPILLLWLDDEDVVSCCASNLTVNFSTIIVGRASCPSPYLI